MSTNVIHCVLSLDCFVRTGNPMHMGMRHLCLCVVSVGMLSEVCFLLMSSPPFLGGR